MNQRLVFLLLISFFSFTLMAQRYTVNGYVYDESTGERLIGASILDTLSRQGTTTNTSGFYSLTLPQNQATCLQFNYVGLQPVQVALSLRSDTLLNVSLHPMDTLQEITVVGHTSISGPRSVQMSAVEVPVAQIKGIPAIGGEVDVLKALQLLPGVQSGNEGSAGMYVRGGGPEENLILLDGVPLYSVNHMLGFFSVFNADAVKNVTLYKGNFPARFGSRLSSVIDVRQNDGNAYGYHGNVTLGLVSGKFSVEGPIPFPKGKTTFNLSARRTLYDLFVSPMTAAVTTANGYGTSLAGYYFWDVNAKLTHTFSDNDKISGSFYMGQDVIYARYRDTQIENLTERIKFRWDWGNILAAVSWEHRFLPTLFSSTQVSFTRYHYNLTADISEFSQSEYAPFEFAVNLQYNSTIMDALFQHDYQWRPNNQHEVKFGATYCYHIFDPEIQRLNMNMVEGQEKMNMDTTLINNEPLHGHEASLYIEDTYSPFHWLSLNLGARFSLYHIKNKTYPSIEPRLGLRALLYKDLAFKASYSYMSQYVHMLSNTSVSLPTDLWVPVTDKIDPMRSMQVAAGFSYNILGQVELCVEGYYKYMINLLEYKDGATYLSSKGWQDQVCMGDGWSYGVEVLLQRQVGPVTGWIGYTWSRTMRQFNREGQVLNFGRPFHAKYDREHDFSTTIQWQINPKWQVAATFVYGTGTRGTFGLQKNPAVYSYDGLEGNPYTMVVYQVDERNNFQMPDYHRLDIGATWQEPLKKHPSMSNQVGISIYNVYNHQNAFLVYPSDGKLYQLSLFPIFPSVSYSFRF